MIYQIRSFQLKPRTVPEAEKRLSEIYKGWQGQGILIGSFHGEIGSLNDLVEVWSFDRASAGADAWLGAERDRSWPAEIREFILQAAVEIVEPFESLPAFTPGDYGPFYELREYEFIPGKEESIKETWSGALPERIKRSPLLLAGFSRLGSANKLVHLWPYRSLDERMAVRSKSVSDGIWPPPSSESPYFSQRTRILLPAAYSPAR